MSFHQQLGADFPIFHVIVFSDWNLFVFFSLLLLLIHFKRKEKKKSSSSLRGHTVQACALRYAHRTVFNVSNTQCLIHTIPIHKIEGEHFMCNGTATSIEMKWENERNQKMKRNFHLVITHFLPSVARPFHVRTIVPLLCFAYTTLKHVRRLSKTHTHSQSHIRWWIFKYTHCSCSCVALSLFLLLCLCVGNGLFTTLDYVIDKEFIL